MKKGQKVANSYKELKAKADELMRQAEEARAAEIASVVSQIKQIMADYGVTVADLRGTGTGTGKRRGRKPGATKAKAKKAKGVRSKVAPKYKDPATGKTWSGRGKEPTWLVAYKRKGKKREDFAI